MKATWTKVYSGPGYPIDPQLEERRLVAAMPQYSCVIVGPSPETTLYAEAVCKAVCIRLALNFDFSRPHDLAFAE